MTDVQPNLGAAAEDSEALMATYRRLAIMDPPAMRSLAGELQRIADESLASAGLRGDAAADARAGQDARRASAAQLALATVASEPQVRADA